MSKSTKKKIITDIVMLVVLAIVFAVTMPFSANIELGLGLSYYVDANGERVHAPASAARAEELGGELKVHFVNVKQGDCCVIELPDGKNMIIDGANTSSAHRELVLGFIEKTLPDLEYFDYCILTHADADHCGSLDDVLNLYPARTVYRPNVLCAASGFTDPGAAELLPYYDTVTTTAYKNFIQAAYAPNELFPTNVIVTDASDDSQTITGGDGDDAYSLTFYSPLYSANKKYANANDYSSIMLFEYRGFKFVLTGDAEKQNEAEFVAKVASAKTDGVLDKYDVFTDTFTADVIKAGHHGSDTSTSQELLDVMTTPEGAKSAYYVFSCDPNGNTYGHPKQEVLDRITAMGVPESHLLRTDYIGDINFTVRMDEDGSYKLFYGDAATEKPDVPEDPVNPEPVEPVEPEDPSIIPEYTLVHVKIGDVELRWVWLAWVVYAVFVVLAVAHIAVSVVGADGGGKRRRKR